MAEENAQSLNFSSIVGKLKSYNGKTNFRSFLNQFNTRAKLENWDDVNKVNILKCLCIETAQIYINTHPEIDELNFDELVSFLRKRFQVNISKQEAYSSFTNLRQGQLNVRDYINKIDEISENVLEILTEFETLESKDQFLISIFINGLNIEIKKMIGIQEFASYNTCMQAALKAEKLLPNRNYVHNVSNNETSEIKSRFNQNPRYNNRNRYNERNINIRCYHCNELGHKKPNCPRLYRRKTYFTEPKN